MKHSACIYIRDQRQYGSRKGYSALTSLFTDTLTFIQSSACISRRAKGSSPWRVLLPQRLAFHLHANRVNLAGLASNNGMPSTRRYLDASRLQLCLEVPVSLVPKTTTKRSAPRSWDNTEMAPSERLRSDLPSLRSGSLAVLRTVIPAWFNLKHRHVPSEEYLPFSSTRWSLPTLAPPSLSQSSTISASCSRTLDTTTWDVVLLPTLSACELTA